MSQTPKKPCIQCKRVLTTETRCPACQAKFESKKINDQKKYDRRRGKTTQRGYGSDWQKIRDLKIQQNPLCECDRCLVMGRTLVANTVHHIKPVETHPELRLDMKNLKSMTHHCHEVEEGRAADKEYEDWKRWEVLSA